MAKYFCPLVKDECKKDECVFWESELAGPDESASLKVNCAVLAYMATYVVHLTSGYTEPEEPKEPEIPSELEQKTPEELASELLEYIKKEFPDAEDEYALDRATEMFWKEKGWHEFGYWHEFSYKHPKISIKMEKAKAIVIRKLFKEEFEKEKEMLPKLVTELVEWARNGNIKRLYKYHTGSFLQEKGIELTNISEDILLNKAYAELKKKADVAQK